MNGVTAIAAGHAHSLALLSDGSIAAWGDNTYGQLGISPTTATNSVVPIHVPGLNNVVAIAAGAYHTLALLANGTVITWGFDADGQLGNGTTQLTSPPQLIPGLTGVLGIGAGWNHSVAVLVDGTVRSWGDNTYGQLGDGTTTQRTTPVEVLGPGGTGFLTGVSAVGAGWNTSLARKGDGSAWSWGDNTYGQLSANSNTSSSTPVQMLYESSSQQVSNLAFVVALPGGGLHTDALRSDGTVAEAGLHPDTTHECLAAMSESSEQGVPAPGPETEQPPIADPVPTPQPEERGCPPTPQDVNPFSGQGAYQLPHATLTACFPGAQWPVWMTDALEREDALWHTTSSGDPRVVVDGACSGGEVGKLVTAPTSGCGTAGTSWYACTSPSFIGASGQITQFTITVNSAICFQDDQGHVVNPGPECFDFLTTIGHELGHVRGLTEAYAPTYQPSCTIMFQPQAPNPPYVNRGPGPSDVLTMQRIYGP